MTTTVAAGRAQAARPSPLRLVEDWWGEGLARDADRATVERRSRQFPLDAVRAYWHAAGRAEADGRLVRLIELIDRALTARDESPVGSSTWFLEQWLPMLTDIQQGVCTYETYVGTHVLSDLVTTAGPDAGPDADPAAQAELVVAVLLALLLRHESDHADAAPSARRLLATGNALVQHRATLFERHQAPMWPPARLARGGPTDEAVAEAARRLADLALAAAPEPMRSFLSVLVVPVTTQPDEVMFLRTLQLFETVLVAVMGLVFSGRDALAGDDVDGAARFLERAGAAMLRSIPFFRIVSTMDIDQFMVIRTATTGASGLQSESFKRIELAASSLAPERLGSDGYRAPNLAGYVAQEAEALSIDDYVTRLLERQPGRAPTRLLGVMEVLDQAWLQWKKTHWAIATRLIGARPGTGGTDGAVYLRRHMIEPLFPCLHS